MVGLSVLLESHENGMFLNGRRWTRSTTGEIVVNQTAMKTTPSSFVSSSFVDCAEGRDQFLHQCFLCKQKILENKDIYMYMGDMAFCSEDCRLDYMTMETTIGVVEKQAEEESGERLAKRNVKKESLFSADCSPPNHGRKKGYKSHTNGEIAC